MMKPIPLFAGERSRSNHRLQTQLDFTKNCLKDDWDMLWIISSNGKPGPGKSTLASQFGIYNDAHFSLSQCVFSGRHLVKEGVTQKNKQFSIVYDEAKEGLNKKRQMTEYYHNIETFFDECRQFNPFLILCVPNLFDLPRSIVVSRSSAVVNVVYSVDEARMTRIRGEYHFYGEEAKKKLYLRGVKEENYNAAGYDFGGSFTDWMPFNKEAYRRKKAEASQRRINVSTDPDKRWYTKLLRLINSIHHNEGLSTAQIGAHLGCTDRYIRMLLQKFAHQNISTGSGTPEIPNILSNAEGGKPEIEEPKEAPLPTPNNNTPGATTK